MNRLRCRLCGRSANESSGYLARVNELGELGVWECRPSCSEAPTRAAILEALDPSPSGRAQPEEALREAWARIDAFCRKRVAGPTATILDDLRVVGAALASAAPPRGQSDG